MADSSCTRHQGGLAGEARGQLHHGERRAGFHIRQYLPHHVQIFLLAEGGPGSSIRQVL